MDVLWLLTFILLAAGWRACAVIALRDLRRRRDMTCHSKIIWAIVIVCIGYLGALSYLISKHQEW